MTQVARPGTVCPVLRLCVIALGLALTLAGCASWLTSDSTSIPSEVTGEWQGSMNGQLGRGTATLVVQPEWPVRRRIASDGRRPFVQRHHHDAGQPRRAYAGADGNGIVTLRQEDGRTVLKFVRDGGGSTATFVRPP